MAPTPHNLKVGDLCWLVVQGEDKDNANIHKCTVTEVDAKNEYTVHRPGWVDELMDVNNPAVYSDLTVSGLSHMEGVLSSKKVITGTAEAKEGSGFASLCQMDLAFRERGYEDMVDMSRLNDAELARNLRIRAINKAPYCRCGATLVAINLYEDKATYKDPTHPNYQIFAPDTLEKYKQQADRDTEEPHPWSLAAHCYGQVFQPKKKPGSGSNDQAIVITGESGSGKTFTTGLVLDFVATVGADPSATEKITDLMLSATPILEGFGNANMPRNPDSSRFGKLYKVYFDPSKKIVTGCTITPYMLEKSRVSSQQMNERNFHIFYRMIAPPVVAKPEKLAKLQSEGVLFDTNKMGFSPEEKQRYKCQNFEDFIYLKGGDAALALDYERIYGDVPEGWSAIPSQPPYPAAREYDDAEKMGNTKKALTNFFSAEQIDIIWRVTSGCLWLGNVAFEGEPEQPDVCDSGMSKLALDNVCELWQVDRALLKVSLNTVEMKIGKVLKPIQQSLAKSKVLRDSMSRTVYNELFKWMVAQMSHVLSTRTGQMSDRQPFIGVLDIFGFEFYADETLIPKGGQVMNTLDQYNINMCNEVLQGEFVKCIFLLEQALYQDQIQETIDIDFDKNDDTIDLMKASKKSIIACMDQVMNKNLSTAHQRDKAFFDELSRMTKDKANLPAQARLDMKFGKGMKPYDQGGPYGWVDRKTGVPRDQSDETPGIFRLDHYAAKVTYDVRDWVDKNMDNLTSNSYAVVKSSQLADFMVPVFTKQELHAANSTVARDFAKSLDNLVMTLSFTECNFVRCLKASNPLAKNVFKNALVLNQLKYTGMLDTLIIRRGGFPIRMTHEDFVDTYRVLDVHAADGGADSLVEGLKLQVAHIVDGLEEKPDVKQQTDAIRCGKPIKPELVPLVLMRDWFARELDVQANIVKSKSAVLCQAAIRMGFARYQYKRAIAAVNVKAYLRGVNSAKPYQHLRKCTLPLSTEVFGFLARSALANAEEVELRASNLKSTVEFNECNVALKKSAAEERKEMRQEDDYALELAGARAMEQIESLKAKEINAAAAVYQKALEGVAAANLIVDSTDSQMTEIDAKWAQLETAAKFKSIPIIRKFKPNAAQMAAIPADAIKFRFNFSTKK